MGLKSLLLLAALFLGYHFVRRALANRQQRPEAPKAPAEDMVRCAECGLHLPRTEAVEQDGEHYCCREHANRPHQ